MLLRVSDSASPGDGGSERGEGGEDRGRSSFSVFTVDVELQRRWEAISSINDWLEKGGLGFTHMNI